MSHAHAKNFVDHANRDHAMKKKVVEAVEHILKVGKEHGYEFSRAELHDALRERWGGKMPASHELSDPDTCVCIG